MATPTTGRLLGLKKPLRIPGTRKQRLLFITVIVMAIAAIGFRAAILPDRASGSSDSSGLTSITTEANANLQPAPALAEESIPQFRSSEPKGETPRVTTAQTHNKEYLVLAGVQTRLTEFSAKGVEERGKLNFSVMPLDIRDPNRNYLPEGRLAKALTAATLMYSDIETSWQASLPPSARLAAERQLWQIIRNPELVEDMQQYVAQLPQYCREPGYTYLDIEELRASESEGIIKARFDVYCGRPGYMGSNRGKLRWAEITATFTYGAFEDTWPNVYLNDLQVQYAPKKLK